MASGVDARLLKSTKFPPEFSKKVDMQKVNLQVMKKWIAGKISEILGNEDDVVIELVFNLIEGPRYPDIKSLQIQLTGFLDKDTAPFCKELWRLMLSAQTSPQGVPKELLEAKKLELIQEKLEADRAAEDARRRRDELDRRERDVSGMKERDRRDRGPGREEEAVLGEAATDHDHRCHASGMHEIPSLAIATFHEEGVAEGAIVVGDKNQADHPPKGDRLDRAHAVVVGHRAATGLTAHPAASRRPQAEEIKGRGLDHQEQVIIDVDQSTATGEGNAMCRPGDHGRRLQTGALLLLNEGDTLHPEADQWNTGGDVLEVCRRRGQGVSRGLEALVAAANGLSRRIGVDHHP
ncbi:Fc.00g067070.m01.CDS01 [Cosmosporella sp. VM-42]